MTDDMMNLRALMEKTQIPISCAKTALVPGRPLQAAELFAVASDPTPIATLGCGGRNSRPEQMLAPAHAAPVVRAELATLRAMGTWEEWLPLASAICALAPLLLNRNPDPNR